MWLGATLSTILHVSPMVLLLVGLPVLTLALSQDKKEPEMVDTQAQAGARKAKAAAKTKSDKIEITLDTAKGQETDEKITEDAGQSAPNIEIQIISATDVPSIVQKVIEKQTAAINKSKQIQPDNKPSKIESEPTTPPSAAKDKVARPNPQKTADKKPVAESKSSKPEPKAPKAEPSKTKPAPVKIEAKTPSPVKLAQTKKQPAEKPPQTKPDTKEPRTKRGGGGADGNDNTGGGQVGQGGGGEGKDFGALSRPTKPIQSAKTLIDIIEAENPDLLKETSRSPAGNQTPERVARQERNFKRIERTAKAGHANAQYNLAKLLLRDQGTDQDFDSAREWLQKAADTRYTKAQVLLGYLAAKPGPRPNISLKQMLGGGRPRNKATNLPRLLANLCNELCEHRKFLSRDGYENS